SVCLVQIFVSLCSLSSAGGLASARAKEIALSDHHIEAASFRFQASTSSSTQEQIALIGR
ncbi:Protein THEMIS, partial [Dissostichus eleginoides]